MATKENIWFCSGWNISWKSADTANTHIIAHGSIRFPSTNNLAFPKHYKVEYRNGMYHLYHMVTRTYSLLKADFKSLQEVKDYVNAYYHVVETGDRL